MKVDLTLTLDGDEEARRRLRLMSESFVGAPRRVAHSAAEIILEALKRAAPSSHSARHVPDLRESLGFVLANAGHHWTARYHGNRYVKWVIDGHGWILPGIMTGKSRKKVLRFEIDGQEIFTRKVRPTIGKDFRKPAMAAARPLVEALMQEEGIRTIRSGL